MMSLDIARQRLVNQHLSSTKFDTPEEVVRWLGAVQSQDYAGAKWALAQRMNSASDAALDQAFADGAILRTHVMRPTWHFVTPEDIRWMLALTAPRVHALSAYYYRQLELDDALFARSHDVLIKALQGGKQLTRMEISSTLNQAGVATKGDLRMGYILIHAELDGIVCSGARRGKQFTYALLDERVPQAKTLEREEAVAELVRRYFTSHGPAMAADFVWWSGLTTADAKAGLEMVRSQLIHETVAGKTYWFSPATRVAEDVSPTAYLLPNYDEFTVSYRDRSAFFDPAHTATMDARSGSPLNHAVVVDGQLVGMWRRTFEKGAVVIEIAPFFPLSAAISDAVAAAAQRFGEFLGMPVVFA